MRGIEMIDLTLVAKVPFIMNVVMVVWVFIAIALILIILIQKGKGGGLSGAFGGLGAGGLLGTKTGDFLTWVTICFVVAFLGLAVVMVKYYKPSESTGLDVPPPTMPLGGAPGTEAGAGSPEGETPAPAASGAGTSPPTQPTGETDSGAGGLSSDEGAPPEKTATESAETIDE